MTDALDARALRALTLDVLGRPPFREEWEAWLGRTRAAWVEAHVGGLGFWRQRLDAELYALLLIDEFRPPTGQVDAWAKDLSEARVGALETLHRILLSTEFDRRNPGADTFVTVVMEELLGVTVQKTKRELERGKAIYDGNPGRFLGERGTSQADVVKIAMDDPRTARRLVARTHRRLMRAELEEEGLQEAAARIHDDRGALPRIVAGWLAGPRWPRRLESREPMDNRRFVRAVHVDLLDRLPSEEETRRMRTALDGLADPRPLRAILVRLMLDSGRTRFGTAPETPGVPPAEFVEHAFDRLLGRGPTDDERAVFLEVLESPGARPETLVLALLSHPDYQTW